jgi:hypothetical protein
LRHGLIVEKDFERSVANAFRPERYARGDSERVAYRNDYRIGEITTAEAPWKYSAPQVREATQRARSAGFHVAASIATWRFDRRFAWSAQSASAILTSFNPTNATKVSLAP